MYRTLARPRVVVKKSRGSLGSRWYVLAFGKCYWRDNWQDAIYLAMFLAPKHCVWVKKDNRNTADNPIRKQDFSHVRAPR